MCYVSHEKAKMRNNRRNRTTQSEKKNISILGGNKKILIPRKIESPAKKELKEMKRNDWLK